MLYDFLPLEPGNHSTPAAFAQPVENISARELLPVIDLLTMYVRRYVRASRCMWGHLVKQKNNRFAM